MTLNELKKKLDDLSWGEQMEFEVSERDEEFAADMRDEIQKDIQQLAKQLTPLILDNLEKDKPYIFWVLRLSLCMDEDDSFGRGQRFYHHPDSRVRFWATKTLHTQ